MPGISALTPCVCVCMCVCHSGPVKCRGATLRDVAIYSASVLLVLASFAAGRVRRGGGGSREQGGERQSGRRGQEGVGQASGVEDAAARCGDTF